MQKGERIGQGQTAEIFAWGDGQVLKLFVSGRLAEQAAYEARVARAVYAAGIPSPAVGELVEVDGRPGIIYERIVGQSLLALLQKQPWRVVYVAHSLAGIQAATHRRTVPDLPSLRLHLERKIRRAAPLPASLQATALAALAHVSDGDALCHGDLHPDNILMSRRGPLVIDWENATYGHPLADVARTSLLLRMGSLHVTGAAMHLFVRALLTLLNALYVRRYLQISGLSQRELRRWELPVAAARLDEGIRQEEVALVELVTRHSG